MLSKETSSHDESLKRNVKQREFKQTNDAHRYVNDAYSLSLVTSQGHPRGSRWSQIFQDVDVNL